MRTIQKEPQKEGDAQTYPKTNIPVLTSMILEDILPPAIPSLTIGRTTLLSFSGAMMCRSLMLFPPGRFIVEYRLNRDTLALLPTHGCEENRRCGAAVESGVIR